MMHTDSYVGKELGNYRVVTKIASGGFASVFKGQHLILAERIVAIKILHTYLDLKEEVAQFLQEAQILEKLRHPFILSIFDVGLNEGFPYLVTEYALNGSLRDRLNRHPPSLLPLQESLTILTQIGQALQHAHQHNVVHRDLKPENILFNAKSEALLADFGIATVLSTLHKNNATVIGTPAYMAPEQFEGIISKESDQYALGCIAYELLTGQKPFVAPNFAAFMFKHFTETPIAPTQLNPQVPLHIEQAILKAMAKKPGDRHPDISAFITALYTTDISRTFVPAWNVSTSKLSTSQTSGFKQHLNATHVDENAASRIPLDVPPYVRQAVTTLDSAIADERYEAIKTLDRSNHPAALVALVKALEHPIDDVRGQADRALRYTQKRHPAAQEALVKVLVNPETSICAARALAYYHDLRALPILIEALAGERYPFFLKYYFSDDRMFSEEEIQFLLKAMSDESKDIRRGATVALAKTLYEYFRYFKADKVEMGIVIASLVPALLKALDSDNAEPDIIVPALNRTAFAFLNGLQNSNVGTRRNSAWTLSMILPGIPPALESWDRLDANDDDRSTHYSTPSLFDRALPILRKARKDRDEYVRDSAIWTYDQIKK